MGFENVRFCKRLSSPSLIVIPWLGVLSYLILRGDGMQNRTIEMIEKAGKQQREYIQNIAGVSTADELTKLADLKEKSVITDTEFEAQKAKLLL